jgi:hypothetical protein
MPLSDIKNLIQTLNQKQKEEKEQITPNVSEQPKMHTLDSVFKHNTTVDI